jgi:hypothetical protein
MPHHTSPETEEHPMNTWTENAQPAARGDGKQPCPFCGAVALSTSYGDIPQDTRRVEFHCHNDDCEAREIVVLAERTDPGSPGRADFEALRNIDTGALPDTDNRFGGSRVWSGGDLIEHFEHDKVLARRTGQVPLCGCQQCVGTAATP